MAPLADTKTEKVTELIAAFHSGPLNNVLVVGCGSGLEAAILAQRLKVEVTGIDIRADFDPMASGLCRLEEGDATALRFEDESFDFVFSYHALEHIQPPEKALSEMRRVMRPGAGFWIGTPNRGRLVGYIGGKGASLADKLSWNLIDWRMRLTGRFENRLGAHAGFTRGELKEMLTGVFGEVDDRTFDYFLAVYPSRSKLLRLLETSGVSGVIFPSVYFSGRR